MGIQGVLCAAICSICVLCIGSTEGGVISVPTGSVSGVVGATISITVKVDPPPSQELWVNVSFSSRNEMTPPKIEPNPVILYPNTSESRFNISTIDQGRFYLHYSIIQQDVVQNYTINAAESLVLVFQVGEDWDGIIYQLKVNVTILFIGLLFFIWRRTHRMYIPFWRTHKEGLFERIRCASHDLIQVDQQYSKIGGATIRERFTKFRSLPCDGAFVADLCGIEAALSMRFHLDSGHLLAALSICSVGVLLPINYLSGIGTTRSTLTTYTDTTISNVPLNSNWYWAHVVMCYVVAGFVTLFLLRQYKLMLKLQSLTSGLIGTRSIFIQAGVPVAFTSYTLRKLLEEKFSNDIEQVSVIQDLNNLYKCIDDRKYLRNECNRIVLRNHLQQIGKLCWCLKWLPGSSCLPSPSEFSYHYTHCLPCRSRMHVRSSSVTTPTVNNDDCSLNFAEIQDDDDCRQMQYSNYDRKRLHVIEEQLQSFPTELLTSFQQRRGTGGAIVVFKSVLGRQRFLRFYKSKQTLWQSCNASIAAAFLGCVATRVNDTLFENQSALTIADYMPNLVIQNAPEPNDIKWSNMTYRPKSMKRICTIFFYQLLTISILVLFSTPTAVLMYMNLDPNSPIYRYISKTDNAMSKFIVTYLPSLLLIVVNWLILLILFYMSIVEPWFSESRRMRSFLSKGFSYLFLSSILFPSIGVTAVYLSSNSGLDIRKEIEKAYVERFLYKLCSNFCITYISQLTFLGCTIQLLRIGERMFYQPWLKARAVTKFEKDEAEKPWPFYFCYDYAIVLSVFMVAMLGSALSPIVTPFGAFYFYLKFYTVKYNFLYVHPHTAGRGNVARTAYSIVLICVLIFEAAMTLIMYQIGSTAQFAALFMLTIGTIILFIWWRIAIKLALQKIPHQDQAASFSHSITLLHDDQAPQNVVNPLSYLNPYESALRIFTVFHIHHLNQTELPMHALKWGFNRLKQPSHSNSMYRTRSFNSYLQDRQQRMLLRMTSQTRQQKLAGLFLIMKLSLKHSTYIESDMERARYAFCRLKSALV